MTGQAENEGISAAVYHAGGGNGKDSNGLPPANRRRRRSVPFATMELNLREDTGQSSTRLVLFSREDLTGEYIARHTLHNGWGFP